MSWRRFVALLSGLSPRSRWVQMLSRDPKRQRGEVRRITDPKAAEVWFATLGT